MKILLSYNSFNKVREVSSMDELHSIVQNIFNLPFASYRLQKHDEDFNEFVDIEDEHLQEKDKIRVLESMPPVQVVTAQDYSDNSLSFSTEENMLIPETQEVRDASVCLRKEPWPTQIVIPFEKFSQPLKDCLMNETKLSWDLSRELVAHLATYIYYYKAYPSKADRLEVCQAVVLRFPYLRNHIKSGIEGLELKLLNKLKKIRLGDCSKEIVLNRELGKVPGKNVPLRNNVNQKKGEVNRAPDHVPGENLESAAQYRAIMAEEATKSVPDGSKISALMALTYSFRRELINAKILVRDLMKEYPAFFLIPHQFEEFHRVTAVGIKERFDAEAVRQGLALFMFFQRKKKNVEEAELFKSFEEKRRDLGAIEKTRAEYIYGLYLLPLLLKEPKDALVELISDDTTTPELEHPHPKILTDGDFINGTHAIYCEGILLCKSKCFLEALCCLISFYYTLSIAYPKIGCNTLKFLQNSILHIKEGTVPPKVKTLINKMLT